MIPTRRKNPNRYNQIIGILRDANNYLQGIGVKG